MICRLQNLIEIKKATCQPHKEEKEAKIDSKNKFSVYLFILPVYHVGEGL